MGGYEVRHEETTKVEAPLATETPLDTGRGSGERPLEGGAMMGEREGQAGSHEMRAGTDDLRGEEQVRGTFRGWSWVLYIMGGFYTAQPVHDG